VRYGVLTVTTDSTTVPSYSDEYTENFDTGITFSVTQVGNVVSVKYTSTNSGLTGTLTYSLNHLA
jgi:predicted porin